jgi:hypothetical protein
MTPRIALPCVALCCVVLCLRICRRSSREVEARLGHWILDPLDTGPPKETLITRVSDRLTLARDAFAQPLALICLRKPEKSRPRKS